MAEPEDLCADCGAPLDDGEGWDGLCGDCADLADPDPEDETIPGDLEHATELTPEGEQYVIPGTEKRTTPGKPQGDLW